MSGSLITGQCFSLAGFKVLNQFCFSVGVHTLLKNTTLTANRIVEFIKGMFVRC